MSTRFYQSSHLNVERMVQDVERMFAARGYQTQHFTSREQTVLQVREGGDFEAVLGMQAALTVILQPAPNGVTATIGEQKWIDKAAAGLLGAIILWPLLVTAGVGVIRQASLEHELLHALDAVALQQGAQVHVTDDSPFSAPGSPPHHAGPQPGTGPAWGQGQKPCPRCQALNDAGDAFCSRCGAALNAQPKSCANCGASLKADAAFCTRCGTAVAR